MAREISPVCDFIFESIQTGLPMDAVDIELMIRMVKGINTYRKDHTAESTVFSPWSRTVIPSPSMCKKIQAFQDKNRQTMMWNNGLATSYFSAPTKPKCKCAPGKTKTRWSNQRYHFSPIKTERYNTQDRDLTDFSKIHLIQPTPRDSALELSKGVHNVCSMPHIPL